MQGPKSGDENDDGKEDDASLPASRLRSETPKPGPSRAEETVEYDGSADPTRELSPRAAVVETGKDAPTGQARPATSPEAQAGDKTVTLALLNGLDVSCMQAL